MADVVNTNQFKSGMAIEIDGQPFTIVEFQHVKPGKGGAFVRTKVRNIATGAVLDKTFRAGEKFDRMHTQSRKMAFLYATDDEVVLMDNETYEQVSVAPAMAEDALTWVVENMEVEILYLNGQPFELAAPNFVGARDHASPIPACRATPPGRHEARHPRVRRHRPGAAVHRGGREGQGRHPQRGVPRPRLSAPGKESHARAPGRHHRHHPT